jgi:glucose-inhibited division protein A
MAAARLGLRTALFTLNVDLIAQMSCNPAVGGIAKGHLVREVDALGGIMGEVTDAVGIQFRLLNTSRGPAVWSPRAQCDKQQYRLKMREVLESQCNLQLKQAEVAGLLIEELAPGDAERSEGLERTRVCRGVRLRDGRTVAASAVVVTTGTFLNGLIHCGEQTYPAGRSGEPASVLLGEFIKSLGLRGCRLKTGTPRVWTAAPSIGRVSPRSRATKIQLRSASAPARLRSSRCHVTSLTPRRRLTASSAITCTARRCTADRSTASGLAIAPRSRTRSSNFPTRKRISFIWNRRA